MFVLFKKDQILAFKTCGGLYGYIRHLEQQEGKGNWVFARYSYQRLVSFYQYVRSRKISGISMGTIEAENKAKPDVLEILTGDSKRPRFLSVTPNVDVASMQEDWCHKYCRSHGYPLFKVTSPANFNRPEDQPIGGGDDQAFG